MEWSSWNFHFGKAACHSECQNQLLPSQARNTKFRDYDKSGSTVGWQLCGAPEEWPVNCVPRVHGVLIHCPSDRRQWATPRGELGRVYMRIQQTKRAFNCIPRVWRLSTLLFSTLQDLSLLFKIRGQQNVTQRIEAVSCWKIKYAFGCELTTLLIPVRPVVMDSYRHCFLFKGTSWDKRWK